MGETIVICCKCGAVKTRSGRWVHPGPSWKPPDPSILSHGLCEPCYREYDEEEFPPESPAGPTKVPSP